MDKRTKEIMSEYRPNRFSYGWWRNRFVELFVALGMAFIVISIAEKAEQRDRELLPTSAWFVVNEIYIPDHKRGSNPDMIYDRDIREPFNGFWIAEAQRMEPGGLFKNECSGSSSDRYDLSDTLKDDTVSWTWFFKRPCEVPAGMYRVQVHYVLSKPGWPDKELTVVSNTFKVFN